MTPEQRMWQSVVNQALLDVFWDGNDNWGQGIVNPRVEARDRAHRWLSNGGKDFRDVCNCAGIAPEFLRESYVLGKIDRNAFYNEEGSKNSSKGHQKRTQLEEATA